MKRKGINEKFKALYEGRVKSEPFLEFILESLPMKIFDPEVGNCNSTKNL